MELNILNESFRLALNELNLILGRVIVLDSFLTNRKQFIDEQSAIGENLIATSLNFRDVTLKGNVNNLMLTGSYSLNRTNLTDEINMILSRECLFQIAQGYEIIETLLYTQVAELISNKSSLQLFFNTRSNESNLASIRKGLRNFGERKNNRHLLAIIRANCKVYSKNERDNIYGVDFGEWYELISEVRHCITHNRMVVSSDVKVASKLFKDSFMVKRYDDTGTLFIERHEAINLISRITEFAFLIYKAIAEEVYGIEINEESIQPILKSITNRIT